MGGIFGMYRKQGAKWAMLMVLISSLCSVPARAAPQSFDCAKAKPQELHLAGAQDFPYTSPARTLYLHVFEPANADGNAPAVIFYFGGGWRIGRIDQFEQQARAFAERGFATILVDYRVACRDNSTPLDSISDARAAYQWVRSHSGRLRIDRSRIALAGGSAGGQLALMVAMTAPPAERPGALILFNPALVDFMAPPWSAFGLKPSQVAAISPDLLPISDLPPLLIMHSKRDTTVPIERVRKFCGRVLETDGACTLIEYPGLDHGFFNSRQLDPQTGVVPVLDTTAKAIDFLAQLGWRTRLGHLEG